MRKIMMATAAIGILGIGMVAAHAQDALGGALLGAGAGAVIGGAASGGRGNGAVAGAIIGGTAGAIIGSQSDQRRGPRYRRDYDEAPVYYQRPAYRAYERPAYRERVCWQDDWGRTICR